MLQYENSLQPFPRQEYSREDMFKTLEDLKLVPTGSLVLKKGESSPPPRGEVQWHWLLYAKWENFEFSQILNYATSAKNTVFQKATNFQSVIQMVYNYIDWTRGLEVSPQFFCSLTSDFSRINIQS